MARDDQTTRRRRGLALSAAGMSEQQVAAEVLLLLPSEFLDAYEQVFLAAWGGPGVSGPRPADPESAASPARPTRWRTSSGQTETRGAASTKGRARGGGGVSVRDIRAQATKEWADRKLRKLARDVRTRLQDEAGGIRRCTGSRCRRLAEDTWNYCPNCGAPTEDVAQSDV